MASNLVVRSNVKQTRPRRNQLSPKSGGSFSPNEDHRFSSSNSTRSINKIADDQEEGCNRYRSPKSQRSKQNANADAKSIPRDVSPHTPQRSTNSRQRDLSPRNLQRSPSSFGKLPGKVVSVAKTMATTPVSIASSLTASVTSPKKSNKNWTVKEARKAAKQYNKQDRNDGLGFIDPNYRDTTKKNGGVMYIRSGDTPVEDEKRFSHDIVPPTGSRTALWDATKRSDEPSYEDGHKNSTKRSINKRKPDPLEPGSPGAKNSQSERKMPSKCKSENRMAYRSPNRSNSRSKLDLSPSKRVDRKPPVQSKSENHKFQRTTSNSSSKSRIGSLGISRSGKAIVAKMSKTLSIGKQRKGLGSSGNVEENMQKEYGQSNTSDVEESQTPLSPVRTRSNNLAELAAATLITTPVAMVASTMKGIKKVPMRIGNSFNRSLGVPHQRFPTSNRATTGTYGRIRSSRRGILSSAHRRSILDGSMISSRDSFISGASYLSSTFSISSIPTFDSKSTDSAEEASLHDSCSSLPSLTSLHSRTTSTMFESGHSRSNAIFGSGHSRSSAIYESGHSRSSAVFASGLFILEDTAPTYVIPGLPPQPDLYVGMHLEELAPTFEARFQRHLPEKKKQRWESTSQKISTVRDESSSTSSSSGENKETKARGSKMGDGEDLAPRAARRRLTMERHSLQSAEQATRVASSSMGLTAPRRHPSINTVPLWSDQPLQNAERATRATNSSMGLTAPRRHPSIDTVPVWSVQKSDTAPAMAMRRISDHNSLNLAVAGHIGNLSFSSDKAPRRASRKLSLAQEVVPLPTLEEDEGDFVAPPETSLAELAPQETKLLRYSRS